MDLNVFDLFTKRKSAASENRLAVRQQQIASPRSANKYFGMNDQKNIPNILTTHLRKKGILYLI